MRRAVGGRADVRRRGLKDADAAAIAAALAPGAPGDGVVGLDASENAFTRVGVEALASALRGARGNRSLAHVTVRGTRARRTIARTIAPGYPRTPRNPSRARAPRIS